jgi:hypothetical protein
MNSEYSPRKFNRIIKQMLNDNPELEVKEFVLEKYRNGEIKRNQIPLYFWRELSDKTISEERKIELLTDLRKVGFPYYFYDLEEFEKLFKKLKELDILKIEETTKTGEKRILMKYNMFTKLASVWFPHMMSTPVIKMKTPMFAWNNDKLLTRTVQKCFSFCSSFPNFGSLFSMIRMVSGVQTVSNFKPEVAKYIYEKFNTENKPINIFDFSMGYGGRLVGAMT